MFPIDPSKMDPKVLMELSRLVQQLPPEQLSKMQTLMHNMMAGFNVQKEMEDFEKTLPPGFREKIMQLMAGQNLAGTPTGAQVTPSPAAEPPQTDGQSAEEMNLREARLTILRAVSAGQLSPEDAERLLFKE